MNATAPCKGPHIPRSNRFCGTTSQKKFTDKKKVGIRMAFYNISILMYFCELVKGKTGISRDLFYHSPQKHIPGGKSVNNYIIL